MRQNLPFATSVVIVNRNYEMLLLTELRKFQFTDSHPLNICEFSSFTFMCTLWIVPDAFWQPPTFHQKVIRISSEGWMWKWANPCYWLLFPARSRQCIGSHLPVQLHHPLHPRSSRHLLQPPLAPSSGRGTHSSLGCRNVLQQQQKTQSIRDVKFGYNGKQ